MELLGVRVRIHSAIGKLVLVVSFRMMLSNANFIILESNVGLYSESVLRLITVSRGGLLWKVGAIAVSWLLVAI